MEQNVVSISSYFLSKFTTRLNCSIRAPPPAGRQSLPCPPARPLHPFTPCPRPVMHVAPPTSSSLRQKVCSRSPYFLCMFRLGVLLLYVAFRIYGLELFQLFISLPLLLLLLFCCVAVVLNPRSWSFVPKYFVGVTLCGQLAQTLTFLKSASQRVLFPARMQIVPVSKDKVIQWRAVSSGRKSASSHFVAVADGKLSVCSLSLSFFVSFFHLFDKCNMKTEKTQLAVNCQMM